MISLVRSVALALTALLATPSWPAAAAQPQVDLTVGDQGSTVAIHASVFVACDRATAWKVLTDYGYYASFIPSVETSRVVTRDGTHVVVEQTDLAPPWLLRMPVEVVYRITEYSPTRIVSRASLDGGDTLDSEYRLTAGPQGTRLDYVGRLTARRGMLEWLHERAGARAIGEQVLALAREMEREARESGSRAAELIDDARH
jgi:hypothetical protein